MFTGIVEEIGMVKAFVKHNNGANVKITCRKILEGLKIGDSVAINGVCTTVTSFDAVSLTVDISDETLNISNFKNLKINDSVNLERALLANSRLGGHIVSGHVDCCAKLISIEKLSEFYNLEFELPPEQMKYVVYKGSIAVNGISLTISKESNNGFCVAVIPHTFVNTNLKLLKTGDIVNIETDILGRYVEKMLSAKDNVSTESHISVDFLKENGFV